MLPHIDQQAKDESHAESRGVANSCHERGLDQWPGEGQQLYAALLAQAEPYMEEAGHRWQRQRW